MIQIYEHSGVPPSIGQVHRSKTVPILRINHEDQMEERGNVQQYSWEIDMEGKLKRHKQKEAEIEAPTIII